MIRGKLKESIEELIATETGEVSYLCRASIARGGCINRVRTVEMEDGRRFLVKSNSQSPPGMFESEARGLRALRRTGTVRVPDVIGVGGGDEIVDFLVLEYIQPGRPQPGFFRKFGRQLALLHEQERCQRFGFEQHNYLGSTPQPNGWAGQWVDFWREKRLGYQLRMARKRELSGPEMDRLGDRLLTRLGDLLGQSSTFASLLHGDLWSGNYLCDEAGEPVLIDPAVYFGHGEADIAMTHLFGGFEPEFYSSYEEVRPPEAGSEVRLDLYKLYHLLNHLNLFGHGYHGDCMTILQRYAA